MGHQESLAKLEHELDDPEVADFLAFLRIKGTSSKTQLGYLSVLRLLRRSLAEADRPFSQITVDELRSFIIRNQEKGLAAWTVATRVMQLKRFYGFLLAEGYCAADPMRRIPVPKTPRRLPQALTRAQVQQLYAQLSESPLFRLRDKVIITLMYTCGLRITEAVSMRRSQLDLAGGTIRVLGKGSRERRVFLRPDVVALLERYLAQCPDSEYVFPSPRGGHITRNHIQIEVRKYAQRAGLPDGVTPHTLRHSCATHYLLGGAPLSFVQQLLGHASLRTTQLYTGIVDEEARRITLEVPLAFELEPRMPSPKQIRDRQSVYAGEWSFSEAEAYVALVLEWLAG